MTLSKNQLSTAAFAIAVTIGLGAANHARAAFTLTGTAAELVSRGVNADFETPAQTRGDGENFSNNNLGPGWTFNFIGGVASNHGVQDPAIAYYGNTTGSPLPAPFENFQVGFINLNAFSQAEIISEPIGRLQSGQNYTLNVAVGARNNAAWPDLAYRVGLRASDGTDLGTFATTTLDPAASPTMIQDLQYTLSASSVPAYIGSEVSIVIGGYNTALIDGVITNAFSQANFDNVRLAGTFDDPLVSPSAALTINRQTGTIGLKNTTGINLNIVGYSLTSDAGAFDQSAWLSIANNYDQASAPTPGNGSVDSNDPWTPLSAANSATDLSESELSFGGNGGTLSTSTNVTPLNLGNAWYRTPFQDVEGELLLGDGSTVELAIEYTGLVVPTGDLNGDGSVTGADWTLFKAGVGTNFNGLSDAQAYLEGDLTGDGQHNLADFVAFRSAFESGNGAGSFAAMLAGVPEPGTGLLLALGSLLGVAGLRRRHGHSGVFSMNQAWLKSFVVLTALFACALAAVPTSAQILYFEDFEDTELAPDTTTGFATIAGGIGSFDDNSTGSRARLVVRRPLDSANPLFTAPVMTFAFDTVAPVTNVAGNDMELLLRAGIGTADNTLSSSEFIIEAILFRTSAGGTAGGPRGAFQNNGNESLFVVVNNQNSSLVFPSPVDGNDVTLSPFQYARYVRNNVTNTFAAHEGMAGIATMTDRNGAADGPGDIIRLGIGTSSSGHQGTFAIDNVLVYDGITFINPPDPPPTLTLRVDPATGMAQIRNDSDEDIAFRAYRITSPDADDALNPSGWDSIATGSPIAGFPQGNGTGNGWEAPSGGGNNLADYNADGEVDAADYVMWRKTNINASQGYTDWRTNFGEAGGGPGGSDNELVEWYLTGDSTLTIGSSISLGQAFDIGGAQTLGFQFATSAGLRNGMVEYAAIGSGGEAVPEPSTVWLMLLAGCAIVGCAWHRRATACPALARVTACVFVTSVVVSSANATVTNDRVYRFGENGGPPQTQENGVGGQPVGSGHTLTPGNPTTLDHIGPSGSFQTLEAFSCGACAGTDNTIPVYQNLSGLGRTGLGILFDGDDDYLNGFSLGFPTLSRGTVNGGGSGTLNYNGVYQRGIQLWVYPHSGATAEQHVVSDTTEHGVRISAGGTWILRHAGTNVNSNVSVAFNTWSHVMAAMPDLSRPHKGVLYIDGVAIAAQGEDYSTDPIVNAQALIVGANTDANGTLIGTTNFFRGVLDELEMFIWGRGYNHLTDTFTDFGTFNFATDNEYAADFLTGVPGDINNSNSFTQADVNAFVAGWMNEKRLNNQRVGDLTTFADGDLNFDGITDLADARLLMQALPGAGGGGIDLSGFSAVTGVPEPSSLCMAAFAVGGLFIARRGRK